MDFPKYHKAHHAMDRLMLYWSAALIAMLISMSASGETEYQRPAEFSIYLFQEGLPIADAELTILSVDERQTGTPSESASPDVISWRDNGGATVRTNDSGSIAAKL
ncbi:MAG TPA: hypothetical protein PKY85_01760, partial [Nitrosomonas sp.]|nr:hypothetical protein [Nitrosomonas sp.]